MPIDITSLLEKSKEQDTLAERGNANPAVQTSSETEELKIEQPVIETKTEEPSDSFYTSITDTEEAFAETGKEIAAKMQLKYAETKEAKTKYDEAVQQGVDNLLKEADTLDEVDKTAYRSDMIDWVKNLANETSGFYQYYKDDEKLNFTDDEWYNIALQTYTKLTDQSVLEQAAKNREKDTYEETFKMQDSDRALKELDKIIAQRVQQNQTGLEKVGHCFWGMGNMAVADAAVITGAAAGIPYFLADIVIELLNDSNPDENAFQTAWRNALYNPLSEWGTSLSETGAWSPAEQERLRNLGINKTAIYGEDLGSFIAQATQSWGFTAMSMLAGIGEAEAIAAIMAKGTAKKTAKRTAKEAARLGRELTEEELLGVKQLVKENQLKLSKTLNSTMLPVMGAVPEAMMNAVSVKNEIEDDAIKKLDEYYDGLCRNYVEEKIKERLNEPLTLNSETGRSNDRSYSDADIENWYKEAAGMYQEEMQRAYAHIHDVAERAGSMNFFMDAAVTSISGGLLQSTMLPKKAQSMMKDGKLGKIFNKLEPVIKKNEDGTFSKEYTKWQKAYAIGRESVGEAIEEGLQSIDENVNTAVANWDIERFVQRQHESQGVDMISDDLADHFGAAYNAFIGRQKDADGYNWEGSVWNKDVWKSAAMGGLGSVIGGPGMTHTNKFLFDRGYTGNYKQREKRDEAGQVIIGADGKPVMEDITDIDGNKIPERAWFRRGVTETGDKETTGDVFARMVPWRTGVGSQYLDMRSQERGQYRADAEELTRYFKKYHSGDAWEDNLLDGLIGTANTLAEMNSAAESGDIFGLQNAATEQLVETAWVLGELKNSSSKTNNTMAEDFLQNLQETANMQEGEEKSQQMIAAYKQTEQYKKDSDLQKKSDEEIHNELKKNATEALAAIEHVSDVEEEVSRQYGHYNLDRDTKRALIYSKIMVQNGNERISKIEDALGKIKYTKGNTTSQVTEEMLNIASEYDGGIKGAIDRYTSLQNKIDKVDVNIKRLEKAEKEKKITANAEVLKQERSKKAELEKEKNKVSIFAGKKAKDLVLSAQEIMALPSDQRLTYLMSGYESVWNTSHPNQPKIKASEKKFHKEQQEVIDRLRQELLEKDSEAMDKIVDVVKLQGMVNRHRDEQQNIMQDPKKFAEYAQQQRISTLRRQWEVDAQEIISLGKKNPKDAQKKLWKNLNSTTFSNRIEQLKYISMMDALKNESWFKEMQSIDKKTNDLLNHLRNTVSVINSMSDEEFTAFNTLLRIGYLEGIINQDFTNPEVSKNEKFDFNGFVEKASDLFTQHPEILQEWKNILDSKGGGIPTTAEGFVQFMNPYRGRYNLIMQEKPNLNISVDEKTPSQPNPTNVSTQPKIQVETQTEEAKEQTDQQINSEDTKEISDIAQQKQDIVDKINTVKNTMSEDKVQLLEALQQSITSNQQITQETLDVINDMIDDVDVLVVINNQTYNDLQTFINDYCENNNVSKENKLNITSVFSPLESLMPVAEPIISQSNALENNKVIEQPTSSNENKGIILNSVDETKVKINRTSDNKIIITSPTGNTQITITKSDSVTNTYTITFDKVYDSEMPDVIEQLYNSIPEGINISLGNKSKKAGYEHYNALVENMEKTNTSVEINKKVFANYRKTNKPFNSNLTETSQENVFNEKVGGLQQKMTTVSVGSIATRYKSNPIKYGNFKAVSDLYTRENGIQQTLISLNSTLDPTKENRKVFYIIDPTFINEVKSQMGATNINFDNEITPVIAVVEIEGKGRFTVDGKNYNPIGILATKTNNNFIQNSGAQHEIRQLGVKQIAEHPGETFLIKNEEGKTVSSDLIGIKHVNTTNTQMTGAEYAKQFVEGSTDEEKIITWMKGVNLSSPSKMSDKNGNTIRVKYATDMTIDPYPDSENATSKTVTEWLSDFHKNKILTGSNEINALLYGVYPLKRLGRKLQKLLPLNKQAENGQTKFEQLEEIVAKLQDNPKDTSIGIELLKLIDPKVGNSHIFVSSINDCLYLQPSGATNELSYRIDENNNVILTINVFHGSEENQIASIDVVNLSEYITEANNNPSVDFNSIALECAYNAFFDNEGKLREAPRSLDNESKFIPLAKLQISQNILDEDFAEDNSQKQISQNKLLLSYASLLTVSVSDDNKNVEFDGVELSSPFVEGNRIRKIAKPLVISNPQNANMTAKSYEQPIMPRVETQEQKQQVIEKQVVQMLDDTKQKVNKLLADSKTYFEAKEKDDYQHTGLTVTGVINAKGKNQKVSEEDVTDKVETPATIIGNKIDSFLRDLFDDSIEWTIDNNEKLKLRKKGDSVYTDASTKYINISNERLIDIFRKISELKSEYPSYTAYSKGIALTTNVDITDADNNVQSVEIHGEPDLILISPEGEAIVIDFKTTNDNSILSDDSEERNNYFLQTALYAKALKERGFKVQECKLLSIGTNKSLMSSNLQISNGSLIAQRMGMSVPYKLNSLLIGEIQSKNVNEIAIPQFKWENLSQIQKDAMERQLSEKQSNETVETTVAENTETKTTKNQIIVEDNDMDINDLVSELGIELTENESNDRQYNPNSLIEQQKKHCNS